MIATIILTSIAGIIIFRFFFVFFSERKKDLIELENHPLEEKFSVLVSSINLEAFGGKGEIVDRETKFFNLYREGSHQLVTFIYGTGHLTIIWRYEYLQKEVCHKIHLKNVRNINASDQYEVAESFILEMRKIIKKHKYNVSEPI